MKRNLISVIILAFSIINFIMLAIIIFTVIPTNKKTDNLITSIASIIDLSVEDKEEADGGKKVDLADLYVYTLSKEDTVTLKKTDEDTHFAVIQIAISMNMKSDDYKKYSPEEDAGIKSKESVIQSTVDNVISKYTAEECLNNKDAITKECKEAVKDLFNSDVIYDVSFSKYVVS